MKRNFSNGTDRLLILSVTTLALLGILAVYSATRSYGSNTAVFTQTAACIIGFILMQALCHFDYEQFIPLVKYIFIVYTSLLILVLITGIVGVWGSKSWFKIGAVSIQPSELTKCGFIITMSYHLMTVKDEINKPLTLLKLGLHLAVPVILVLLQPDFGTAIVFVFIFCMMLFTAKISFKYIISLSAAAISLLPIGYLFLNEYQKNRIRVFLNPESDPLKSGYNVIQSKIAVGSGELYGRGFLQGPQNQHEFLPAKSTDFIFSCISEEFGFIGSMIVLFLLFIIILRCIRAAQKADNLFGRYICIGVAAMLFFHTLENIGMCIGLMPVTGIPLPFLSYGGTSLITNFACIGLVLSVSRFNHRKFN